MIRFSAMAVSVWSLVDDDVWRPKARMLPNFFRLCQLSPEIHRMPMNQARGPRRAATTPAARRSGRRFEEKGRGLPGNSEVENKCARSGIVEDESDGNRSKVRLQEESEGRVRAGRQRRFRYPLCAGASGQGILHSRQAQPLGQPLAPNRQRPEWATDAHLLTRRHRQLVHSAAIHGKNTST